MNGASCKLEDTAQFPDVLENSGHRRTKVHLPIQLQVGNQPAGVASKKHTEGIEGVRAVSWMHGGRTAFGKKQKDQAGSSCYWWKASPELGWAYVKDSHVHSREGRLSGPRPKLSPKSSLPGCPNSESTSSATLPRTEVLS